MASIVLKHERGEQLTEDGGRLGGRRLASSAQLGRLPGSGCEPQTPKGTGGPQSQQVGRGWGGGGRKSRGQEGACAPEGQLGRGFHPKGGPPALSAAVRGETLGRAADSRGTWSVSPIPTWVTGSLLRSRT